MPTNVRILMSEFVTHDTKRFIVTRLDGYTFTPGQATDLAIDEPSWRDKRRPFTFTSHSDDLVLEFMIKRYPKHNGVTNRLHQLHPGDKLLIDEAWGAITYQGPGFFVAAGTGITPFIAIFRSLRRAGRLAGNKLLFSNKTARDIILRQELEDAFGDELVLTVTQERAPGCEHGRIDEAFLKRNVDDFSRHFYVCGPPGFVDDVTGALARLGAKNDAVVVEA